MNVGLFIPCYINTIYPHIGVATYRLLTSLGIQSIYIQEPSCCGQPLGNAGYERDVKDIATAYCKNFSQFDYVVTPSASCAGFMKHNYGNILCNDKILHECNEIYKKTYELCEFLHDVLQVKKIQSSFPYKVSMQNSCHGVRQLQLSSASELLTPRYSKIESLLSLVRDIEIVTPERIDECCGFGGMFSLEESSVSSFMGRDKVKQHMDTGAQYICGADSSCLMHLTGIIEREKYPIKTIHVVEILTHSL